MPDIATLGLAVDSTQVTKATTALDGLARAAKPAADATTALGKAAADAAKNVDPAAKGAERLRDELGRFLPVGKGFKDQAGALGKASADAAKNLDGVTKSGGLARHEMINLSRQLQDIGVSLAGGQSPLTVLFQQGSQVADIFGSSKTATVGGAFKQIAGGIAGVLTPARLLAGGLGALAIGGALAIKSLANSGKAFDDVSRSIGVTTDRLHALQQAASFKGIGQNDFFKGIGQFGAQVYDAQHAMGGLAEVMAANGKSAKDFNGYLEAAAELIKNASSDQQRLVLLQQMGLPATMDWVRLLSQGKDGIRAAQAEAIRFNETAEGKLIASARKFDDEWNKATTKFVNYFKSSMLEVAASINGVTVPPWLQVLALGGAGALGGAIAGPVGAAVGGAAGIGAGLALNGANLNGGAPAAPKRIMITGGQTATSAGNGGTVDKDAIQRQIQLEQQRLGIIGQVATIDEQIRSSELSIKAARLQPGSLITDADVKRVSEYAKQTALGVTAIRAQADAYRIDSVTVGMSVGAAVEYAAVQQRINAELAKGNVLRPDQLAAIQKEAGALGQAAANADNLRFAYGALVQGPIQTFTSAIGNGAKAWDAFKQAGQSALNSIASKLADMAAQNLWASAFGGSSGGGLGGLLGSLFGGGGSGVTAGGAIAGAVGPTSIGGAPLVLPGFAGGTDFAPGGVAVIGERGPELVNLRRGAQVIDAASTRGLLANREAPIAVHVGGNTSITIEGNADERTVAMLRQELAARDAALPGQVVAAVKKAKAGRFL